MPTYEYECSECGEIFDLFQSMSEPARRRLLKSDPKPCDCNARVTRRICAGGGIIFKGSGFYKTDYRSDSYKKAAKEAKEATGDKKDSDGKAKEKTATDGKAEKKPAKKESKPKPSDA